MYSIISQNAFSKKFCSLSHNYPTSHFLIYQDIYFFGVICDNTKDFESSYDEDRLYISNKKFLIVWLES